MQVNKQLTRKIASSGSKRFKSLLSPGEWRRMTQPIVPKIDRSVIEATKLNTHKEEMSKELLTRKQLLDLFNLKKTSFFRIRRQPGFPERILPGTARAYRYDPVEVKVWFEKQEEMRQALAK